MFVYGKLKFDELIAYYFALCLYFRTLQANLEHEMLRKKIQEESERMAEMTERHDSMETDRRELNDSNANLELLIVNLTNEKCTSEEKASRNIEEHKKMLQEKQTIHDELRKENEDLSLVSYFSHFTFIMF